MELHFRKQGYEKDFEDRDTKDNWSDVNPK